MSDFLHKVDTFSDKLQGISENKNIKNAEKKAEKKGEKVTILGMNPLLAVTISVTLIIGISVAILFIKNKKINN